VKVMLEKIRHISFSPFPWLALLYILSAKGHLEILDTAYSLRTALAIIEEGTMLIDPVDEHVLHKTPVVTKDGKMYSQYGIGLLAIFVPIALVGKVLGSLFGHDQDMIIAFILSFYNVPFALLGLWFFRGILLKLSSSFRKANYLTLTLGIATAFWKYTATDFSEITQIAFLLGALNAVLSEKSHKWRRVSFWCALLVAIKLVYVVVLPVFAIYSLLENRGHDCRQHIATLIDFSIVLIPTGFLLMAFNWIRFDNPFESGYGPEASGFSWVYFKRDFLDYFLSFQRGLFAFTPLLLAGVLFWPRLLRTHRAFGLLCLSLVVTWFILMATYKGLQGGYCWGNRLLIPTIPILAISWVFLDWKRGLERWCFTVLSLLSIVIQLVGVSLKTHEYSVLSNEVTSRYPKFDLPQLPGSLLLFINKLGSSSSVHDAGNYGGPSGQIVDLTSYESFSGFNYWPVHACKLLNEGFVHPVSLIMLSLIIAILVISFALLCPNPPQTLITYSSRSAEKPEK